MGGSSDRSATFSRFGTSGGAADLVHDEVGRLAVVDAGRVDAEQADVAFLEQKARRVLADAGEVEVAGIAGRVVAEIGERVGPALRASRCG